MIELMLFENDPLRARRAVVAGISQFIVDWELTGKAERQKGYDTQIRPGTAADLAAVAAVPGASVWCRINSSGPSTRAEVDRAVACGAAGIILPMVTSPSELEAFLGHVDGRCATGFMLETVAGFAAAADLATLPCDRVYFGLNDFAISRGGGSIFRALADGSVERARDVFADRDFGFGGLTAMDGTWPVPPAMLAQEMVRLNCTFTYLRRSFHHDMQTRDIARAVAGIRDHIFHCRNRTQPEVQEHRRTFEALLSRAIND